MYGSGVAAATGVAYASGIGVGVGAGRTSAPQPEVLEIYSTKIANSWLSAAA
jgi:hypothetical protein